MNNVHYVEKSNNLCDIKVNLVRFFDNKYISFLGLLGYQNLGPNYNKITIIIMHIVWSVISYHLYRSSKIIFKECYLHILSINFFLYIYHSFYINWKFSQNGISRDAYIWIYCLNFEPNYRCVEFLVRSKSELEISVDSL